MTSSIHDNLLVSYEVRCQARTITLRIEYRAEGKPTEFTNVIFDGVEGYRFENDAFGNIIFDVANLPLEQFLTEYGAEMSELYRMTGLPKWARGLRGEGSGMMDMGSAPAIMREAGVKGFVLSSSLGLSGWVLAKQMSIIRVE